MLTCHEDEVPLLSYYIQKPFSMRDFATKFRAVLDEEGTGVVEFIARYAGD